MNKFTITLTEENGKLKVKTSPLPENGNLSEIERIGKRIAELANNFSGDAPLWRKALNFFLG